jgi:hypothetical protein
MVSLKITENAISKVILAILGSWRWGPLEHRQLGMALAFPPPFFSVQSYGLYVTDVRGGTFTQYQATCCLETYYGLQRR